MNPTISDNRIIHSYQGYAASGAFLILIFISFFGTSATFPDRYEAVEDIATSNIYNQFIYLLIFFLAFYSIHNLKREVFHFVAKEKFLSLLILWYFLGMLWSVDPFATFKQSFRLLTIIIVILAFFIHNPKYNSEDIIFKYIAAAFVLINIVLVFTVPGATDPDFGTWRGICVHKNIFGQVNTLLVILFSDLYLREKTTRGRIVIVMCLVISIVLLFGSQSSTSIIGFLAFIPLISVTIIDRGFKTIGLGRFISTSLMITVISILFIVLNLHPELINNFVGAFGKDTTFTGRTDLWYYAIVSIEKHFPLGTGIGAFWNVANKDLSLIHQIFPWLPMEFHSGIIEILNEAGVVGFLFFLGVTIKSLIKNWKYRKTNLWFYLIIIILILNLQETTILTPNYLATTLFLLAYIRINFQDKSVKFD